MEIRILAYDPTAFLLQICAMVLLFVLLGPVLLVVGWRFMQGSVSRTGRTPYCAKCGYNLTGVASKICPECGTPRGKRTVVCGEPKTNVPLQAVGWVLCVVGAAVLLWTALMVYMVLTH